jgi:hypothetical protein
MAWQLAASLGMQALGGLLGGRGAKRAARERAAAFAAAAARGQRAVADSRDILDPRLRQEQQAIERVNALLGLGGEAPDFGLFRSTPGYQFALEEGQRAIERAAAAGGGLVSGNTLAELTRFGTGLADQTYQNYLATLLGLQSQGVDAALADMRTTLGEQQAGFRLGSGEAIAAGREQRANALIGALSGMSGILGQQLARNQLAQLLRPGGTTTVPATTPSTAAATTSVMGTLPVTVPRFRAPGLRVAPPLVSP